MYYFQRQSSILSISSKDQLFVMHMRLNVIFIKTSLISDSTYLNYYNSCITIQYYTIVAIEYYIYNNTNYTEEGCKANRVALWFLKWYLELVYSHINFKRFIISIVSLIILSTLGVVMSNVIQIYTLSCTLSFLLLRQIV